MKYSIHNEQAGQARKCELASPDIVHGQQERHNRGKPSIKTDIKDFYQPETADPGRAKCDFHSAASPTIYGVT